MIINYGQPWSIGDLETLARLRDEGKTYAECAAHLGRTKAAVAMRVCLLRGRLGAAR